MARWEEIWAHVKATSELDMVFNVDRVNNSVVVTSADGRTFKTWGAADYTPLKLAKLIDVLALSFKTVKVNNNLTER